MHPDIARRPRHDLILPCRIPNLRRARRTAANPPVQPITRPQAGFNTRRARQPDIPPSASASLIIANNAHSSRRPSAIPGWRVARPHRLPQMPAHGGRAPPRSLPAPCADRTPHRPHAVVGGQAASGTDRRFPGWRPRRPGGSGRRPIAHSRPAPPPRLARRHKLPRHDEERAAEVRVNGRAPRREPAPHFRHSGGCR